MELRFHAMFCSNLGNENCDTGYVKRSRGSRVPHPWYTTFDILRLFYLCHRPPLVHHIEGYTRITCGETITWVQKSFLFS